jgi:hypothetical protein
MGMMVPVRSGNVKFYVETVGEPGVTTVGSDSILSFDRVRETLRAIAGQLDQAWDKAKPTEESVEFGLNLTAKSGKLTGLVVEGAAMRA